MGMPKVMLWIRRKGVSTESDDEMNHMETRRSMTFLATVAGISRGG